MKYVTHDRSSELLRRRCDALCTSGFADDVMAVVQAVREV